MQPLLPEDRPRPGSYLVILFPCLFMIVFLMHFHRASEFFQFKWYYAAPDPEQVVPSLVRAHNRWPLFHDPHILGYLSLPLLLFCAFALYQLSREARPRLSSIGLFVTVSGIIYLGGLFGMWTAFYRGLGEVDPALPGRRHCDISRDDCSPWRFPVDNDIVEIFAHRSWRPGSDAVPVARYPR